MTELSAAIHKTHPRYINQRSLPRHVARYEQSQKIIKNLNIKIFKSLSAQIECYQNRVALQLNFDAIGEAFT